MSSGTLALTVLGATATSTGIGIAVANLTNTNNENIEKKIEKLWEEIAENIGPLASQISTTSQNQDSTFNKKILSVLTKIYKIATNKNSESNYTLNPYDNPQEMYTQLQQIQKEMDEVLELIKKSETSSI